MDRFPPPGQNAKHKISNIIWIHTYISESPVLPWQLFFVSNRFKLKSTIYKIVCSTSSRNFIDIKGVFADSFVIWWWVPENGALSHLYALRSSSAPNQPTGTIVLGTCICRLNLHGGRKSWVWMHSTHSGYVITRSGYVIGTNYISRDAAWICNHTLLWSSWICNRAFLPMDL